MMVSSFQADALSRVSDADASSESKADNTNQLIPGSVLLRVNKTAVTTDMSPADVLQLISQEAPCKVAYRDMDSFMHLIHLRDGLESLDDVYIANASD